MMAEQRTKRGLTVIAVDPGDKHVGVAVWQSRNGDIASSEVKAERAVGMLNQLIFKQRDLGEVRLVIEEFRLYPGKAAAQSWSPMATAEMIGALKWVAQVHGVQVVMQGADIKIPTKRQLKARGIPSTSRVKSGHASDALLHLHHYLLRQELED